MASLDWNKILKAAKDQGWTIEKVKNGQRLVPPDRSKPKVVVHSTPSDVRAIRNKLRDLRHSGLQWPPPEKGKK